MSFLPPTQGLKRLGRWVLPFQCPLCRALLDMRGVCPGCWKKINFFSGSCCIRCSQPFPFVAHADSECAACVAHPPVFSRSLSVFAYDSHSKSLILRFKHGADLSLAPLLSGWLVQRFKPFFRKDDLVVPVPLHWTRLWNRRFNQAAVLGQRVAKHMELRYAPMLLKRIRRTPSQGSFTSKERALNVARAFQVAPRHKNFIAGRRIILVDDVYTTGSTLQACAQTLLKAGAKQILTLTVAKVVRFS